MKFSKLMLAVAASSMTVAPAMAASSNPASTLSVAQTARAGGSTASDSEAAGGFGIGAVFAVLIVVGIGALVYLGEDQNDSPDSP
jgi:hypothetical protein